MSALQEIPVTVEAGTGNIPPLLHEIRHALARVARGESGTVIDLRSLPLAPGEEEKIEAVLGEGEVQAELQALGPTSVLETAYAGVWIVTHRNTEDEIVARFIEVGRIPEILRSQPEDIERSAKELQQKLQETTASES